MKIAYAGIDLLSSALYQLDRFDCTIMKIFTCKTDNITEFNTEIIEFAEKKGIPYTTERITKDDLIQLKNDGCQLFICGGYYYLIPCENYFPMLNIHPTLLPEGRGPWPMPKYILKNRTFSGVTIHKIAESFDTGDIVISGKFDIMPNDNLSDYMKKASNVIKVLIPKLLTNLDKLLADATPQGEGEYWQMPAKEEATIYSNTDADCADRILRAFYGYECYYKVSLDSSENIIFLKGEVVPDKPSDAIEASYTYLPLKGGYIKVLEENILAKI